MTAPAISIPARTALIVIRAYQLTLSAFLGRQCRFAPSCSDYATEAIVRHGAVRGGWLALRRIGRCHPWGGSGYDPVPDRFSERVKVRDGADACHPAIAAGVTARAARNGRDDAGRVDAGRPDGV